MVLRKPYKFLIKHFRFIHLVLAILSSYLLTKTYTLWNFFKGYLDSSNPIVATGTSKEYFSSFMIVSCLFVIVGSVIILILMRMKKKPVLYYFITIISYLLIIIVYIYDNNTIKSLELNALDVRIIGAVRDFTQISFIIQLITTIVFYVRAVGFSIKKFDFASDMKLEADEKDNEEFEFEVTFNKDRARRKFKRNIRHLRIAYLENKFIVNISIVISFIIIIGIVLLSKYVFHRVYNEGRIFSLSQTQFQITDSYITNTNYKNEKITDNYLIVVKFNINKYSNIKDKVKFNTAASLLKIGEVTFNPTTKYSDYLLDFGTTYTSQNLVPENQEFILTFEIPKKYINKRILFSYYDSNKYYIKLSPKKFKGLKKLKSTNLKQPLVINNTLFNDLTININDYEINNKLKAQYNFCLDSKDCILSNTYVTPTYDDNYDKVVLKLNADIDFGKTKLTNKNLDEFSEIISTFGIIKYAINGEEKEMRTQIKPANSSLSSDSLYYFQVYKEIKNADKISLILMIRNSQYEFVLK